MSLNPLTRFALLMTLPAGVLSTSIANDITGPSSSQSPYLLRSKPGVVIKSIISVGDAVNYKPDGVTPYRMVGIPDGLGAFNNGDGTFTLLVNQELGNTSGIVRAHGQKGAFVSKWIIDSESLEVLKGEDLMQSAYVWNTTTHAYQPATSGFTRFCSGNLAPISAFYNAATGFGYNGRIYMNGEEAGSEGRSFAHFMDGNSYELPALGKLSWENSVANPATGNKTVVAGTDDSTPGQVYIYVGTKSTSPDRVAAAGLSGGVVYGIKLPNIAVETDLNIPAGPIDFTAVNLGDVSGKTGAVIDADSITAGVTRFNRPEDSSWDPSNPTDLYFVTTASFAGKSRLWRLRFNDPARPELGGKAEALLDSSRGPRMMDNITVSKRGSVFIQEDVGNNAHIGKVWRYSIATGALEEVAQHDPARFLAGGAKFLTQDEESSGIIPADEILGEGWYLLDVQAHYGTGDGETVEGGQIMALHFPPGREK